MDSSRSMIILGLSFTGVTLAVAYLLFRKDEEVDYDVGLRTSRKTVIKVNVPAESMGTVIGRGGCNIKSIQEKTGARINCGEQASRDNIRVVTIQGAPEAAQLAESMIHEIIMNQPLIITHEMWVPSRACGRIIGKGGETIRLITRTSCARIIVDSTGGDERSAERRVLLKGTAEQIELAQALINEKVQEDSDQRRRVEMSIANRPPRGEQKENLNYLMSSSDDKDEQLLPCRTEKFDSVGSKGFFDVFVSAFENPGQFWLQMVTPRGAELDQLVDKMTEYYEKSENKKLHTLQEINIGQIVAAPFDHDDKWYRGEILKIEENEYEPSETRLTLYYGDYGDSCIVRRKDVFELCPDFLTLYFQAIECTLADVKPNGDEWSDEASNLFNELADVALWRKKSARVVTYRDGSRKRGHRAGSPLPAVELLMEKNVNIGEELVKQGFALWESSSPTQAAEESNPNEIDSSANPTTVKSNPNTSAEDSRRECASPSADFGLGFSASNLKRDQEETTSSSFISKEKGQSGGKFRPKTLGPPPVSQQAKGKVDTIVRPERYSSDEDDGFTLE